MLHRPPGQATIIATVVRLTPEAFDALRHTYFDLAWGQQGLKPLRRQLLDRLSALAGSNPDRLARVADLEARSFSNAIAAETAMKAGGDATDNYNMLGLRAEIAAARLRQFGYDKASAQMVAANTIEEGPLIGIEEALQLLDSVKAHAELRRIASAFLRAARSDDNISVNTAKLFAAAADAYRLAGDTSAALASAREGMKIIPQALGDFGPETANMAERRRLAGEDNGMRRAPALALYRAGAEAEALASNFLAGRELLQQWTKPLDQFDPAWLVDDGPKWREVVISDVIATRDRAFAARVYEAFLASPETEPRDLAILAAASGKRQAAINHLKAMREIANIARELHGDRTYYRLATVTAWKTAEMLLENLPQAS